MIFLKAALLKIYVKRCVIWWSVENNDGGVLPAVNLQIKACSFTKSNTHPSLFFTVFELYKWYETEQSSLMQSTYDNNFEGTLF